MAQENKKSGNDLLDQEDGEELLLDLGGVGKQPFYTFLRQVEIGHSDAESLTLYRFKEGERVDRECVVKVRRPSALKPLRDVAHAYEDEKNILGSLNHNKIVARLAYDGRLHALYLEALPPSLEALKNGKLSTSGNKGGSVFELEDYVTIIQDISSALVYMEEVGCFHNNIQPAHVTYSPQRGAVLVGLSNATTNKTLFTKNPWRPPFAECSPWYLPPEYFETGVGSAPGDVWALGITMLSVLGKIDSPQNLVGEWPIHASENAAKCAFPYCKKWFDSVAEIRGKLKEALLVEGIVFRMLEPDSSLRIKANGIMNELEPFKGKN